MILFISNSGSSLPIVHKIKQEGEDVKIYIHSQLYKNSYDGIIDKVELNELKKLIITAEKVIFDSNVDIGILGESLGTNVIGNSHNLHRYETDINDGKMLAKEIGIDAKDDVEGIGIITEMWFDGKEPALFTHSIQNHKWLTGNLGLSLSSQSSCLWLKKGAGLLTAELKRLAGVLASEGYKGAVSVDCTLNSKDKKPYFNSWKFGFRYDSIFCLLSLIKGRVTDFMTGGFEIKSDDFSCSERITIAPYPYTNEELLNGMAKDVSLNLDLSDINGFWPQDIKSEYRDIKCAGNDGIIGIMSGVGRKVEDSFGKIYKSVRKLDIDAPLQFRIDGAKESSKRLKKLNDWNICIN